MQHGAPGSVHQGWEPVVIGRENSPAISTSVRPAEAVRLGDLASGRDVLEIGSAYGYSAIVMALAGARHVTALDEHSWLPSGAIMAANLEAYHVAHKVTMIREMSQEAIPELAAAGRRFGLVFADGDHSVRGALADVRLALTVLEPGGVLAFHDYGHDRCCVDVAEALDRLYPDGPDRVTVSLWEKAIA